MMGLYDDLHVLIEGDEEAQKALHGELAEVAAPRRLKPRLICLGLYGTTGSRALPTFVWRGLGRSKSQGIGVRGIPP